MNSMHLTPIRNLPTNRHLTREFRTYALDVLCAVLLEFVVIALLVLACVAGHAWISQRVARAQMPVIYTDVFLPTISTGETQ